MGDWTPQPPYTRELMAAMTRRLKTADPEATVLWGSPGFLPKGKALVELLAAGKRLIWFELLMDQVDFPYDTKDNSEAVRHVFNIVLVRLLDRKATNPWVTRFTEGTWLRRKVQFLAELLEQPAQWADEIPDLVQPGSGDPYIAVEAAHCTELTYRAKLGAEDEQAGVLAISVTLAVEASMDREDPDEQDQHP